MTRKYPTVLSSTIARVKAIGVAPSPRREFGKLFLETKFDAGSRAILARNHMWDVPSERFGHWNTSFPFVSAFSTSEEVVSAQGDKAAFLGRYGTLRAPQALLRKAGPPAFGRHEDPVAALEVEVALAQDESRTIGFALATSESEEAAAALGARFAREDESRRALEEVTASWRARLAAHRMETPDPTFDAVVNDWARYQAIAARLWAGHSVVIGRNVDAHRPASCRGLPWFRLDH